MPLDSSRTVEELRELRELTGDESGAQRVAWTDTWERAREWLRGKLDGLDLEYERDEAGNQWWTLRRRAERALLLRGPIDSAPDGRRPGRRRGGLHVRGGRHEAGDRDVGGRDGRAAPRRAAHGRRPAGADARRREG